jgi:hypothetical protein
MGMGAAYRSPDGDSLLPRASRVFTELLAVADSARRHSTPRPKRTYFQLIENKQSLHCSLDTGQRAKRPFHALNSPFFASNPYPEQ